MQKRNTPKKTKQMTNFDEEYESEEFMAEMMDELSMHHPAAEGLAAQLACTAMDTAIDLSKLVIENRVRNASNMDDNDIFNIYLKSFKSIMNTTANFSNED